MLKFSKRVMALTLSLLFVFTALSGTISIAASANASVQEVQVQLIAFPRYVPGQPYNPRPWGRPALNLMSGWHVASSRVFTAIGDVNNNMYAVYCVQPGVPIHTGDRNPLISSETFLRDYNNGILDAIQIQEHIGRIFQYGYTGRITTTMSYNQLAEYIATQLLIWEVIVGERNPDFSHRAPPSHLNRVIEYIRSDHPQRTLIFQHYDRIASAVINHARIPSFMSRAAIISPTHEMTWDGSRHSVTLTDTNGVLSGFQFSSNTPGVTFTRNGNNLTISTNTVPTDTINISAERTGQRRSAIVFWAARPINYINQPQALVTVGQEITDPVPAFARIEVRTGSLRIVKSVEHWDTRAGFQFEVRRVADNHLVGTFTSPVSGEIYIPNLIAGAYTVREIVPNGFVAPTPNPRTITVVAGRTATLAPSTTFNNIRQRGTITVTKLDRDTGDRAQGDATLFNTIFDIYNTAGERVDTINTGNRNQGTSRPLPIPNVYYVVERTPPNGYTLNPTRHRVELTYFAPNVAIGNEGVNVYNCVIRGRIALIKFTDANPETPQIMPPLEGAIFEVFLRSAGNFDAARPTERDRITTDVNGFAETRDLPFGWYTVREAYAPGDVRLVDPFDVFIDRDGQVHRFILDNPLFYSRVRISKVDSTTRQHIPVAGVEFRVRDLSTGEWISQTFNYPTPTVIDTFRTNEEGWLVMPQALRSGNFELHEISAPYGFVLSGEPIPFTIHSSVAGEDNIIDVVMENDPAMGMISIEKRGNMLVGVEVVETEFGYKHVPVFAERGLPGAVFHVIAAEDIIVGGTLRYTAGQVVDIIKTCADGRAQSRPIFLGSYYLVEKYSPDGFVLDSTPHRVTLSYADQYTPIVHEFVGIHNVRQRVSIELEKWLELLDGQDAPFEDVVFGLFADENIYCVNGELIIKYGSLVSLITLDYGGRGIVYGEKPFANYVIRELQAAEGYHLTDEEFPVVFEYAGQDVALVTIAVNDGEYIRNYLMRGDLRVIKTFENREYPVAGVPFIITGTTLVGTTVVINAYTDVYGKISLDGLLIGEWEVTEMAGEANTGFILSESETVTITTDKLTELEIHNYLIRGDIRIVKVCAVTNNRLSGAVFGLYLDGKRIAESVTGIDGISEFLDVEFNSYEIRELASPQGFILDDTPIIVSIRTDGQLIEIVVENEPIPEIPEVPKTGDDVQLAWLILLLSGLGIAATGMMLVMRNDKKKEV